VDPQQASHPQPLHRSPLRPGRLYLPPERASVGDGTPRRTGKVYRNPKHVLGHARDFEHPRVGLQGGEQWSRTPSVPPFHHRCPLVPSISRKNLKATRIGRASRYPGVASQRVRQKLLERRQIVQGLACGRDERGALRRKLYPEGIVTRTAMRYRASAISKEKRRIMRNADWLPSSSAAFSLEQCPGTGERAREEIRTPNASQGDTDPYGVGRVRVPSRKLEQIS
jgi:hypothetical protein